MLDDLATPGREAAVLGLGTALPEGCVEQGAAAEAVIRLAGLEGARASWTRRLFARAGVGHRRTVLRDLADGRALFGGVRRPGTAERMALYREHAGPLAAAACVRALASTDTSPADVTHLVVVTCTGFHAPGVDVELVGCLGLREDVDRTIVGFMGCHGAFAGLRIARRAVLAEPGSVVLMVCVEICSLHLRADASPDALVAASLFGDGAAAAVVGEARPGAGTLLTLGPAASCVQPGTAPMMGWAIGDDGFEMSLAPAVPSRISGSIAGFAGRLAPLAEVDAWCIHPGGPAVLAGAGRALRLAPEALSASRAVLRAIGNVSSATILFVLERAATEVPEGARGVALGFGPGLTFEGFAFQRGGARCHAPEAVPAAAGVAV